MSDLRVEEDGAVAGRWATACRRTPTRCWRPTSGRPGPSTCCCARLLTAEEAHGAGFVGELGEDGDLDRALDALVTTLLSDAPLSMTAAGRAVARLRRAGLPDGDDLVRGVVGSEDSRAGVRAFVAREQVTWRGR